MQIQKNHKSNFFSCGWVVGMAKQFKRQSIKHFFEVLSDVMQYVVANDGRLIKSRGMTC